MRRKKGKNDLTMTAKWLLEIYIFGGILQNILEITAHTGDCAKFH
jgi:hypothetical protein